MEQIEQAVWNFTPTAECPTLNDAIGLVHTPNTDLDKWIPISKDRLAAVNMPGAGMVRMEGSAAQIDVIRQRITQLGIGEVIEGGW